MTERLMAPEPPFRVYDGDNALRCDTLTSRLVIQRLRFSHNSFHVLDESLCSSGFPHLWNEGLGDFLPLVVGLGCLLQVTHSGCWNWPAVALMKGYLRGSRGSERSPHLWASWIASLSSLPCLAARFGSHLQNDCCASICWISVEHQEWGVWNVDTLSLLFLVAANGCLGTKILEDLFGSPFWNT